MDLNDDVLFLICDHFELKELMNFGQVSVKMQPIAENTFRRKYGNQIIGIVMSAANRRRRFEETDNDDRIDISDLQFALDLLKYFGHLIN